MVYRISADNSTLINTLCIGFIALMDQVDLSQK